MMARLASDIELIRLSEHRLIAISCCDDNQNAFAGPYQDIANFYVGDSRAAEPVLGNGQVAQQFVHGRWRQCLVGL
jgi:hypothetical protein